MPLPQRTETDIKCGSALAAIRKEKGISQHGLAKETGIHRSTLSLLESGRQQLTVGHLRLMAPVLGFSDGSSLLYELLH